MSLRRPSLAYDGCREPRLAHVGCGGAFVGFRWRVLAFVGTSVGRVNGIKKETIKKPYLWLERRLEPLLLLLPSLACVGLRWLSWAFVGLLVWCRGPAWAFVGLRGLVWESLVSVNEIHKKENHLLTRC